MTFLVETAANIYLPQKENQQQTKVTIPPRSNFGEPVCLLGLFTRVWMRSYLEDCVWLKDSLHHPKVHYSLVNEIESMEPSGQLTDTVSSL